MNNEKKEFFNNDVEVNVSEEEIVLAPPTQLFDEATDIAHNTSSDEKLPFTLKYDANKKEFLLSILKTAGALVEYDDEDGHTLSTMMNMTQLAFIKRLDCVERVKAEKKTNPFLDDEINSSNMVSNEAADFTEFNAAAQTMTLSIDEPSEVSVVSEGSVSANIATTSISGDSANSTMQTAKEIEVEEVVYGCICCPGAGQWFKFTAPKTATYTIYTTGSLDTIGALYDSSGKQITCVDDRDECGKLNFRIIRSLNANTLYYIRVSEAISNTGSYRLQVTEKTLVDSISISPSTIILEKGKTYELPMEPDTFVNIDGAEQLSNLSATTVPATADEKRVFWDCLDNDVISITTDWHNGQKYQTITALKAGTATLYAYDWKSHGKRGVCTVTVDAREKVIIKRDGNFNKIVFGDNRKEWLCINYDMINDPQNLREKPFDNTYSTLVERIQENTYATIIRQDNFRTLDDPKSYSEDEQKLLYMIDPYGFAAYVQEFAAHQYPANVEKSVSFKDSVFRTLFNKSPKYFSRNDNGEWYDVTSTADSIGIFKKLSESELFFGNHPIFDLTFGLQCFNVVLKILALPGAFVGLAGISVTAGYAAFIKFANLSYTLTKAVIEEDYQTYVEALISAANGDEDSVEETKSAGFSLDWAQALFELSDSLEELSEIVASKPNYYKEIFEYCAEDTNYKIIFEYNNGTFEEASSISNRLN